jgi:hypothetical protein
VNDSRRIEFRKAVQVRGDGETGLGGSDPEIPQPSAGAAFESGAVAAEARALRRTGGDVGHGVAWEDVASVRRDQGFPVRHHHIPGRAIVGDGGEDRGFVDWEKPVGSRGIVVHGKEVPESSGVPAEAISLPALVVLLADEVGERGVEVGLFGGVERLAGG